MKIKDYLILGLISVIVVILLFGKSCSTVKNTPEQIVTRTVDTITKIETKIDTIVITHTKLIPSKVDTVYLTDYGSKSFQFHYPIKDSLLDGLIIAHSLTEPKIEFNYRLKSFNKETTTLIKDSVNTTNFIEKNKLYFGGEIVVNPMMENLYLGLDFEHKRGHLFNFSLGYDLKNDYKLIKVGYKKRIF